MIIYFVHTLTLPFSLPPERAKSTPEFVPPSPTQSHFAELSDLLPLPGSQVATLKILDLLPGYEQWTGFTFWIFC